MNMNQHIPQEDMVGYIYRTLNDADREIIETHLVSCQFCRAKVDLHELRQRQIGNDLKAELNGATLPAEISFNAILPRIGQKRLRKFWPRLSNSAPIAAAVLGLILAIFGLWQIFGSSYSLLKISSPNGTYPALAGFFFMLVSMDQFDRSFSIRPKFIISAILAFILWSGTFFIGLLNILVVRDLTIAVYIFNGGSPAGASVVTILSVMIAAMVYIGIVIGGAEYHYKHIGQPGSWKLFSWTIFIQLFIMVLPYLVL